MNRAAGDSHPDFTPRQGQYLAFIHAYTLLTLEREGLISRRPGMPRSIAVLVDRADLPALEPGHVQPVKITVQRY
jgi:hypothetical protein